jgi:hypothetical protein
MQDLCITGREMAHRVAAAAGEPLQRFVDGCPSQGPVCLGVVDREPPLRAHADQYVLSLC